MPEPIAADPYAPTNAPLGPEEPVWKGGPSQWVNLGWFLLALLVIPIPWAVYKALRTATTNYTLSTQRLRMQTGILSRQTEEIELYRVRDSAVSQSLFERLFGLGTLQLSSSDPRTPELSLRGIPAPHEVREHFRLHTELMRRARGVRDIDMT